MPETPCNEHETQIQENSREIAELKTRADYKDQRINELIKDNKRIEAKIDKLTETVNGVVVNSIKDDNTLKEEVTKLKTKVESQDKALEKFEKKQQKLREDDRAKTNQHLAYVTAGLAILSFIISHVLK